MFARSGIEDRGQSRLWRRSVVVLRAARPQALVFLLAVSAGVLGIPRGVGAGGGGARERLAASARPAL